MCELTFINVKGKVKHKSNEWKQSNDEEGKEVNNSKHIISVPDEKQHNKVMKKNINYDKMR